MKKQNRKPFISIVIPTYNRSKYLQCAIQGVLQQNFKDYELIISDNASTDDTQKVVSGVISNRVRYFRNKKNIGWIGNLQNAIDNANGKYIFLHGDDDYIFANNCLPHLHEILMKYPVGFVRMNYLTYADKTGDISDIHNPRLTAKTIKSKLKGDDIVSWIQEIDPFFITGQIISKKALTKNRLIQSEYVPWFPAMYEAIKKQGGVVLPEYHFITSWSQNDTPRYKVKNNEYAFEKYYLEVKKQVSESFYIRFLNRHLRILISEFPAARYYLSLKAFWQYALHVLDLDSTKRKSLYFWFYFLGSLVMPKFVLSGLRYYFLHKRNEDGQNYSAIRHHIANFQKIKEDTKDFV